MGKWIKTNYTGIRYKEHDTRKHGIRFDRYFEVRFQVDGKIKSRGLGWSSEGWTFEKAVSERLRLIEFAKQEGLMLSQKEERAMKHQIKEAEKKLIYKKRMKMFLLIFCGKNTRHTHR